MSRRRMSRVTSPMVLACVALLVVGCSSMEDRIENVVEHEIEECKQTDDVFHTVRTQQGQTYEILAELCHLEPSDVEMHNEWRGTIKTGPLTWTAGEDEDERTVFLTRVAWDELDRATSSAGSDDVETLEEAEEHFANAQDQYGDSAWLRQQRLENLLDLQGEKRDSDAEKLLGSAVEDYAGEFVAWAQENDKPEAEAEARLAILDHLQGYMGAQESSIDGLGAQDDRLESALEHAEDEGDTEEAESYREELEERRERRPELREQLKERIANAEREGCGYTDGLNVDGVEDNELRNRITGRLSDFDCDVDVADDGIGDGIGGGIGEDEGG